MLFCYFQTIFESTSEVHKEEIAECLEYSSGVCFDSSDK